MSNDALPPGLAAWADESLASGRHILATSNQGTVLLFDEGDQAFVLKAAMGRGTVLRARRATLEREHAAYRRLEGLKGIPRCYGMLADRYLVLEYIRGTPFRDAQISDREAWFAELLEIIRSCHARGVAHGDLKNKSNLMSDAQGRPCLIDFGATALFREGFHPINHRFFRFLCQLDLNAWVKHKCQGRFEELSAEDLAVFKDSRIERVLRWQRQLAGKQGQR
jgi:serine/threonine protein kinase